MCSQQFGTRGGAIYITCGEVEVGDSDPDSDGYRIATIKSPNEERRIGTYLYKVLV